MAEIDLTDVSKSYKPGLWKKKVQALKGLSLQVERGEVFGLIGPNGAGKSTTIRLLLGLIRPDSGCISFRGQQVSDLDIRKDIGYLPENPYLYDHLNLDELLRFSGRVAGLDDGLLRQRSCELIERLGLQDARRRPLRTFSKGMLQRAGICFALLHDPGLVIFDEPMSGLDPLGRNMVFDLVQELKAAGKTVFFCSHILSDVERLCDRIGILAAGQLVRVIDKQAFRQNDRYPIHLRLPELTTPQHDALASVVGEIMQLGSDCYVSLAPEQLGEFYRLAETMQIVVRGSQSERVPLEQVFIQLIQKEAQ